MSRRAYHRLGIMIIGVWLLLLISACSLKQNNAATRMYHSLTTRYNVYYNGNKQFEEAYSRFFDEQSESYTGRIAFDPISYYLSSRTSDGVPSGLFDLSLKKADKAIKEHSLRAKPERKTGWHKDPRQRAEQAKTEYNGVLYKAWMLRGQSQLYNGQLQEAISTFDYISRLYNTQDDIRVSALLWQIRCLCLAKRPAESKELFAQIDSIRFAKHPLYMGTRAEYHLAMEQLDEATVWLAQFVAYATPRGQRMRLYYLLGQLYQAQGKATKAFGAYRKVLSFSPPPALEFAAKLRSAELDPKGASIVRGTLEHMARRVRYRDHLDQIYYALGKNYLEASDTLSALRSFVLAADSSQVKGQDYALAQIARGDIYMAQRKYLFAADSYQLALPSLSKDDARYASIKMLSEGLEKLRPEVLQILEGDSLLRLGRAPESYRMQVIDSVIRSLKDREAEQAKQRASDSIAQAGRELAARLPGALSSLSQSNVPETSGTRLGEDTRFYFYNPNLLRLGAQVFERQWGKRLLSDLWRFSKKPNLGEAALANDGVTDRLSSAENTIAGNDVDDNKLLDQTPEEDAVYTRAYYLNQLPLSLEAQRKLEGEIELAMLRMSQVLVYDLDLLEDASSMYHQLLERYPQGASAEDALYNLYLLSLRRSQTDDAERFRRQYLANYGQTSRGQDMARLGYADRLKSRNHEIRKAYEDTYAAYWQADYERLQRAYRKVVDLAPKSEYDTRARFLLAMSYAMRGDKTQFVKELEQVSLADGPSDVVALTQDILAGVRAGRSIFAGRPMPIDWDLQESQRAEGGGKESYAVAKRGSRFAYILLTDGMFDINELTYHLTYYNYSEYTQDPISVKPFNLGEGVYALLIGGFSSLQEAKSYREGWVSYCRVKGGRLKTMLIPVAEENLSQIVSKQTLLGYLTQMNSLELGVLHVPDVHHHVQQLLNPVHTSPKDTTFLGLTKLNPSVLDFDVDRTSRGKDGVQSTPVSQIDTQPEAQGVLPISKDRLLVEPTLSYEEVQARQRSLDKQKRAEAKERERERKANLKLKERMQREVRQEKERLRREKERERLRKQKERLRASAIKKK